MDTFCEQIVSIKKTGVAVALFLGLWFLAVLICVFAFLLFFGVNPAIPFLISCGAIYGAYKISSLLNIEYEYIITNGTLDIDKIVNKSKRIRLTTVELGTVSNLEKYNPQKNYGNDKSLPFACDKTDPNAYFITAATQSGKVKSFVFAPNEKLQDAMVKFMPKFISNSAFK